MAAAASEPAGDSLEVVEPVASPQSAEPIEPIEAVVDQAPPEVVEEVASAPVAMHSNQPRSRCLLAGEPGRQLERHLQRNT